MKEDMWPHIAMILLCLSVILGLCVEQVVELWHRTVDYFWRILIKTILLFLFMLCILFDLDAILSRLSDFFQNKTGKKSTGA